MEKSTHRADVTEYVVIYTTGVCEQIPLILKTKPVWLAGKLSLVGGHIEEGESVEEAACRELKEESGLTGYNPKVLGKIVGPGFVVYCCRVDIGEQIEIVPGDGETELVEWYSWLRAMEDSRLMKNLRVIIPLMAMDVEGWTISENNGIFSIEGLYE